MITTRDQTSCFQAKMYQIRIRLGFRPRLPEGADNVIRRPIVGFKKQLLLRQGIEKQKGKREGKRKEREERKWGEKTGDYHSHWQYDKVAALNHTHLIH